jgi:ferrochelatase
LRQMADDGIRHALAMVTSPFESAASYGQYLEDVQLGTKTAGGNAPEIVVLPVFFDQPGFVEATADRVTSALETIAAENRQAARVVYCTHSLPTAMADESPYRRQFEQACKLVSQRVGLDRWDMAYQSRSGPPSQTWLEPDICRYIEQVSESGNVADLVIVPIGFIYEHMETVFDLDEQAGELCRRVGINMVRAATVGCHPRFVEMIAQLVSQYTPAKDP